MFPLLVFIGRLYTNQVMSIAWFSPREIRQQKLRRSRALHFKASSITVMAADMETSSTCVL